MLFCIIITLAAIVLDQLSKYLAVTYLEPIGSVPIINKVLSFTYVENKGAAFGMLADHRWVFMTVSAIVIVAIFVFVARYKPQSTLMKLSLGMIAGGGIGNMIDRVARGYVVDFIDVTCIKFYVFNIADSFVCVGCGLMVLSLILDEIKDRKAKKAALNENGQDGN